MNNAGRPTDYTDEKAAEIVEKLSQGIPLAEICRTEGMPAVRTVSDWKKANATFAADFARAREEGFEVIAVDALKIADTPLQGEETTIKGDGKIETTRGDMLGHRKLQIETRLKLLAKWFPKKYGDKLDVTGIPGAQTNVLLPMRERIEKRRKKAE